MLSIFFDLPLRFGLASSTPRLQEDLVDRPAKLQNAIANLSFKYREHVGELTYRVGQEAKRCGFEVSKDWAHRTEL